jgi:hypothetical protein
MKKAPREPEGKLSWNIKLVFAWIFNKVFGGKRWDLFPSEAITFANLVWDMK